MHLELYDTVYENKSYGYSVSNTIFQPTYGTGSSVRISLIYSTVTPL